jgi:CHAT domain-containing protein
VQDEPLTRKVSAQGAVGLEDAADNLLGGGLRELLRDLHAAGKDHLCVWAHGPFHFLPFHLLGKEGAPLADDWSVTTLPSLQLLDPSRRRALSRGGFAAIGLDFPEGNARGLPALSGAEAEARRVAQAMHSAESIVGAAVNKAAVLDALRTHARVHIATHGELPVNAPAFQALHLGTGLDGDVLHAWEILRLDLGGVDLVTLSACETSLGRLDVSDNLRGFSANLLIAGVSTIVGTLWRVETNCAGYFFTRLYTEIDAGAAKGAAYRTAQLATRARFPKYRDWGAFYLSGAVD